MSSALPECSHLSYILSLLDSYKDVFRCKFVCRQFNYVIESDYHLMARPFLIFRTYYNDTQRLVQPDGKVKVFSIRPGEYCHIKFYEDSLEYKSGWLPLSFFARCKQFKEGNAGIPYTPEVCFSDLLPRLLKKVRIGHYTTEQDALPDNLLDILVDSIKITGSKVNGRCWFRSIREWKLAEVLDGADSIFAIYDEREVVNDSLHLLNTNRGKILFECTNVALSELKPIKRILQEWCECRRNLFSFTVRRALRCQGFDFSHQEIRDMLRDLDCEKRFINLANDNTSVNLKRWNDGKTIRFTYQRNCLLFMGQCWYHDDIILEDFP